MVVKGKFRILSLTKCDLLRTLITVTCDMFEILQESHQLWRIVYAEWAMKNTKQGHRAEMGL